MSKATILKCDFRHRGIVPAIGTFEVDLCAAHKEMLVPARRRTSHVNHPHTETKEERKKRLDRERHARKAAEKRAAAGTMNATTPRSAGYWPAMEAKVMTVVTDLGAQIHINDVIKKTGLTKSTVASTMRRLVKARKVATSGGLGRWRRYHLPAA